MTEKMKKAAERLGVEPADPASGPTTKELAQALCDHVNAPTSMTRKQIAEKCGTWVPPGKVDEEPVASEHTIQAWIERFTTSARKPR